MIATGETILRSARELKKTRFKKVIIAATFGLFNNGFDKFDQAYQDWHF